MNPSNTQTVRAIEGVLIQHATDIHAEILDNLAVHSLADVITHTHSDVRNNDATRVLSRSTGTVDRLVGDVARAAHQIFIDSAQHVEVDPANGRATIEAVAKLRNHLDLRRQSI